MTSVKPYARFEIVLIAALLLSSCGTPRWFGNVTDVDTGEPISGANVSLVQSITIPQPAHGRSVDIASYSTTSDADGKYAFPSWMEPVKFTDGRGGYYLGVPNPYYIRIEKPGYRQESTDGMNVKMKRQTR